MAASKASVVPAPEVGRSRETEIGAIPGAAIPYLNEMVGTISAGEG